MFFNRIGVNLVVDFRKQPFFVPLKRKPAILIIFQTLIILDDIELELRRDP